MPLQGLLGRIGPEVEDPEEETFLLFSQDIPSQNLGFVDSRAAVLNLAVADKDYVIHQSPTILTSNREGGTTGAVVWKITPLVAEYLASSETLLRSSGVLTSSSSVLELGCERNISENVTQTYPKTTNSTSQKRKGKHPAGRPQTNLRFTPLDWEQDEVTTSLTGDEAIRSFDVVLACDCIYNEALIPPLVQTCVDACKLRALDTNFTDPTVCMVAQQLRDPDILESWMKEFHKSFRTWRIPEEALSKALRSNPGFVIHIGILRDTA
ncbi:putative nicotinamide n-methyltransferase protein [Eutypa lata UCREL1]|uniref:Putative nicotinamide n-methyltransferase protein n=1 Tax=Eutypa lata (strain UCR-EL1) TaxID=1287681 RepID=M7TYX2_EUTLA|nr:putative nicotinamide n-methyltransferase protein [Eutypa lata UCREL1]